MSVNVKENAPVVTHPNLERIRSEIFFKSVRSRGPGGQNVNKVSSSAVLYWDFENSQKISEAERSRIAHHLPDLYWSAENLLFLRSDRFRDLEANKTDCEEKLDQLLAKIFFIPKKRFKTKPTRGSVVRRKDAKRQSGEKKKLRQRVKDW